MAVTSIWPVKGRIDKVIAYVRNPEKTIEDQLPELASLHAINNVVQYAASDMKTEKRMFVTGINCEVETAAQEFKATIDDMTKSSRFDAKERVCFHGYQSFAAGEVDADTAHEIGKELAKRLWGDRFQVLVATHCNTDCYHNHFVVCAVSFMDGKKYLNHREDYRRMREESDRLCKEYGLSVITDPKDGGKSYAEYKAEQNGQPTLRGGIRKSIDIAVRGSISRDDFFDILDQMGYVIDTSGKYPKIKHVGDEHFVRFKSLGPGYSLEEILARVDENDYPVYPDIPMPESTWQFFSDYPHTPVSRMSYTAVYRCYYKALTVTKERPNSNRNVYRLVRQDHSKIRSYSDQVTLLSEHNIKNEAELLAYQQEAMRRIDEVIRLRQDMRNALKRAQRKGDTDEIGKIKYNIEIYSRQLSKLRREVTTCEEVKERAEAVREKLQRVYDDNYRSKVTVYKPRERDGR